MTKTVDYRKHRKLRKAFTKQLENVLPEQRLNGTVQKLLDQIEEQGYVDPRFQAVDLEVNELVI